MYCQKCGWKAEDDSARFCQKCGSKLDNHTETDLTELSEIKEQETSKENKSKRKSSLAWLFVAPVTSLVLASGIGYYYYNSQVDEIKEVTQLQQKAEQDALGGDYEEALKTIEMAAKIRPSYELLDEMKELIEQALKLDNSFKNIDSLLKSQKFNEVEIEIANVKELLKEQDGPLFGEFSNRISEKENQLSIAIVRKEIDHLTTVEQLGVKLQSLTSVNHEDKDEVAKLIKDKIVNIATDEAHTQLNEKQFDSALETVENALYYANNDEQLLSLKDRINEEKAAYEEAETSRLEQEMVAAAQEDLKNKTAAVNVENVEAYIDEYGDLHVSGKVKNTATVPISSVELSYSIYNSDGEEIVADTTYVEPFVLKPGETGAFNERHSGVYEEGTIEIVGAKWKLNESGGAE